MEPAINREIVVDRVGDGSLCALRAMVEDAIRRDSDTCSFSVRSGLLLSLIKELQRHRP